MDAETPRGLWDPLALPSQAGLSCAPLPRVGLWKQMRNPCGDSSCVALPGHGRLYGACDGPAPWLLGCSRRVSSVAPHLPPLHIVGVSEAPFPAHDSLSGSELPCGFKHHSLP